MSVLSQHCNMADVEVECISPPSTKKKTSKVDFTDAEIEKIISLWSDEEVLYNCKHADYFKKDKRAAALSRILDGVDKEGEFLFEFILFVEFI